MQTVDGSAGQDDPQMASQMETLKGSKDKYVINYSVKYGEQEYTWVEHNCDSLHKGKMLSLDYRLGQVDQNVQVTLIAKSMQELSMRADSHANMIAQSPKAANTDALGVEEVGPTIRQP